jgi:CBS domain-containing protein
MSSPALACRPEAFLEEVAENLAERVISGLVVVDAQGVVVGVISERDIASALGSPLVRLALKLTPRTPGAQSVSMRVADVMTTSPVTAAPDTPLHTLAEIMVREKINRLPVVHAGRLEGVVTRTDLLRALAGLETEERPVGHPVVIGSGTIDARTPVSGLKH